MQHLNFVFKIPEITLSDSFKSIGIIQGHGRQCLDLMSACGKADAQNYSIQALTKTEVVVLP